MNKKDLSEDDKMLLITLCHEMVHSKQRLFNPLDKRFFSPFGRRLIELEATANSFRLLRPLGFVEKDFLRWEVETRLVDKYGVNRVDYLKTLREVVDS